MSIDPNLSVVDRIAATLGISRDQLVNSPAPNPPAHLLVVDGSPDRFEVWADQVLEPGARRRLKAIGEALNRSKREARAADVPDT